MAATMHKPDAIKVTVTIPVDQLPKDGDEVSIEIADQLVAMVQNGATSFPTELRSPLTLTYVAVNTASHAAEEVHAAINRRVNGRNKVERFTLCDRKGLRMVTGIRHVPLTEVTCKQCRNQLVQDGMLDD